MARLPDKVVLLSGGASGIGAATARLVLREGGKAVLADRDEAKGRALAEQLGKSAMFVPLDVTDEPSWQTAVATTVAAFGGLHGLLNAAGVGVRNSIEDCTLEDYRRVNEVNSMGTFLGCKTAIPVTAIAVGTTSDAAPAKRACYNCDRGPSTASYTREWAAPDVGPDDSRQRRGRHPAAWE